MTSIYIAYIGALRNSKPKTTKGDILLLDKSLYCAEMEPFIRFLQLAVK